MAEMVATARKPIVGGNWKCNPVSAASLPELVRNFDGCAPHLAKVTSSRARDATRRATRAASRQLTKQVINIHT